MLPASRRVKKQDFPQIIKGGRVFLSRNLSLRGALAPKRPASQTPGSSLVISPSCFAFVVSAKVQKTSVGRHLLKRRLSAVVETLIDRTRPGFYFIFYCQRDFSDIRHSDLQTEVKDLLTKAGALN